MCVCACVLGCVRVRVACVFQHAQEDANAVPDFIFGPDPLMMALGLFFAVCQMHKVPSVSRFVVVVVQMQTDVRRLARVSHEY
jgi:hypothetical protein